MSGEPRDHELKSWPIYFEEVLAGRKTFEVRKNDRGFRTGDRVHLREWDPATGAYTGRELRLRIAYLGPPGFAGIRDGYVAFSVEHPLADDRSSAGIVIELEAVPATVPLLRSASERSK
jgi:Domain of unknown function (DUF3850)